MSDDITWFLGFLAIMGLLWFGAYKVRKAALPPQTGSATSTPLEKGVFPAHGPDIPWTPEGEQGALPASGRYYPSSNIPSANTYARPATPPYSEEGGSTPPPDPRLSPLYGRLFITQVNTGYAPESADEYVAIEAAGENTAPVVITGLTVQSAVTHIGAKIPRAWKFPYPGLSGEGEIVALLPGERAYISTGRSRNGLSFALNKCTGYLDTSQTFTPPLPLDCPAPIDEPLPRPPNALSEACYDYLAGFSGCAVQTEPLPDYLQYDGGCQSHLFNKIGYNQCVSYHKNEPDFYRGEWRLFLNRDGGFWRDRREIIELLDAQGKFIHAYSI